MVCLLYVESSYYLMMLPTRNSEEPYFFGSVVIIMDLEQKVSKLEKTIKTMCDKIEHLQNMVLRLSICKLEDPRRPYYNWLVTMNVSEEKKFLAEHVLAILAMRLDGQKVSDFKKDVEGIPSEILYKDDVPHYKDAEEMLMTALELKA